MSKLVSENRIPLWMAKQAGEAAKVLLGKEFPGSQVEVCGSVRREKETCGDLDVMVAIPGMEHHTGKILKMDFCGVPAQVFLCSPQDVGSVLLFLTGSHQLNLVSRVKAKRVGMALNQYGLWDGEKLVSNTEAGILKILGLERFLNPVSRGEVTWDDAA